MVKKAIKETIHAKGIDIGIYTTDFENEFISLTDIAKFRNEDDPRFVIQNWMRNRNTIEFLAVWEELHNPDFNRVQFEAVKTEAGLNRFVMTPAKWIEQMNAIGIISKAGRYGGTFAHSDIAMSFATWISPEFQLFIMKDYRRLKFDENSRLSLNWNLNRDIAKLNYRIHTDAIKENGGNLIESVKLFDVYQGSQIDKGFKSVSYSITFRAADRTLVDDDVNPAMKKILASLEKDFGANLRE